MNYRTDLSVVLETIKISTIFFWTFVSMSTTYTFIKFVITLSFPQYCIGFGHPNNSGFRYIYIDLNVCIYLFYLYINVCNYRHIFVYSRGIHFLGQSNVVYSNPPLKPASRKGHKSNTKFCSTFSSKLSPIQLNSENDFSITRANIH